MLGYAGICWDMQSYCMHLSLGDGHEVSPLQTECVASIWRSPSSNNCMIFVGMDVSLYVVCMYICRGQFPFSNHPCLEGRVRALAGDGEEEDTPSPPSASCLGTSYTTAHSSRRREANGRCKQSARTTR